MKLYKIIRNQAVKKYKSDILNCIDKNTNAKLLDCGCDDGVWTLNLAKKANTKNIFGIEIIESQIKKAKKNKIDVEKSDLNKKFPYKDNTFDIVHANQVIEHLHDTDYFLTEIHRVLKPNGYVIICTENLSSWHNIFSLLFGWQPFSLTNITKNKFAIGNPLAPHNGQPMTMPNSWQHIRVFAYKGLVEAIKESGLKIDKIYGAGYYPINFLATIDPRHSAFLTIKAKKC